VSPVRPELYDHHALVPYLTEWFEWWHAARPAHTHRAFALKARVGGGTLENVLAGRRRPSAATLAAFNRVIGLDPERLAYLQLLGELAAATSIEARLEVLARLTAHPGAVAARQCVGDDVLYLRRWVNVAIRELAVLGPVPDDPVALRGMLAFEVSVDTIQSAVTDLVDLGFVERTADMLVARERAVETPITAAGSAAFHGEMLSLARRSLDEMRGDRRFLGALTLTVPADRIPELHAEIWSFLRRVRDLSDGATAAPDTVTQLQVQLFPLGLRR
jgi:uncharacterized protein (TIGR02147 family)